MTNYEAIKNKTPEALEYILDSIYVAGLNNGLYAAGLEEGAKLDEILDNNPFDLEWLQSEAENATRYVTAEDGDLYVLEALVQAILRNAVVAEEIEDTNKSFSIKIGASVEIRTGATDSDDDELEELEEKLEELLEELEELEEEEPEDEDSEE